MWPGRNQLTLLPMSSFRSVAPDVGPTKVLFLAFFLVLREHRKGYGHVDVLKMLPRWN